MFLSLPEGFLTSTVYLFRSYALPYFFWYRHVQSQWELCLRRAELNAAPDLLCHPVFVTQ